MENLEIKKSAAITAYEHASKNGKTLLENLFGKKVFVKNIIERIKSLEDAIKSLGEQDPEVIEYNKLLSAGIHSHMLQYQSAVIICKSLNEGWFPDWTDSNQFKYFPWFKMGSSSGVGFSYDDYDDWDASSTVGSRLCFKSSELAEYAGNQFTEIYKGFML